MKTLIDLFNLGMMRNYSEILQSKEGLVLNLGAGNKHIDGAVPLDLAMGWDANTMSIPAEDNSVDMIHCYHLLEHVENILFLMTEIRRVLKPGGHINIVVPYYNSHMQASDITHCNVFTERTFEKLYTYTYYKTKKLEPMDIVTNFIMGDCEQNLALMIQLRKPLSEK